MSTPLSWLPPPPRRLRDAGSALLRRVPASLQHVLVEWALNLVFAPQIANGQLDFLNRRKLVIGIDDVGWQWLLELRCGYIRVTGAAHAKPGKRGVSAEAGVIHGRLREYFLLAMRRADPDTLFFQRRLAIEGDTELALAVKNFLDAVDPEQLPPPFRQLARLTERLS